MTTHSTSTPVNEETPAHPPSAARAAASDLRYARIIRTQDGGSAFLDEELPLTEREVADGVPPMLVGGLAVGSDVVFLRTDDFDSQPHPAPREQWVVMLRGTIEVEVSDGDSRRFAPGDLLLVSDTSGSGHVTRATSDTLLSEALFVPIPQAQ